MSLLIACLLLTHMGMPWYWYGIAAVVWLMHIAYLSGIKSKIEEAFRPSGR